MQKILVRYFVLVGILAVFAAGVFMLRSRGEGAKTAVDISAVPLKINGWQAEDVGVDKKTKDILETESVLVRKYQMGKKAAWMSVVYYKDSRVALHLPESCSVGSGSFIVKKTREKQPDNRGPDFFENMISLRGNKGNHIIIYYFETDNLKTSSYQAMRWRMMVNRLKGKSSGGALVRFSYQVTGDNADTALADLKQFIREASPLITQVLFGRH